MHKVLMIGPFPDPISGVSLANKVVQKILKESSGFTTSIINTSYPVFEEAIGSFSLKKVWFFLLLNFKLYKIFKSDIIYITPGQTFFGVVKYGMFILIASLLKKELIVHVHGNYMGTEYKKLKGVKKNIFFFLVSRFTKGIVLSPMLKQNLLPFIDDKKIFIVYNFAQEFLYSKPKKVDTTNLKIVYLSNLMEEKGILFLLNALKDLEHLGIKYEAKIAGNLDVNLKSKIFNIIESLNNTEYIGVVKGENKRILLNWSNIFVLPTFYKMEGQPIAILEALATQNVIITTSHGGIPDIIEDKTNGFIVPPKNHRAILDVFIDVNNNKEKIHEICENNKIYFQKYFTTNKFSEEIKNVFHASPESRQI